MRGRSVPWTAIACSLFAASPAICGARQADVPRYGEVVEVEYVELYVTATDSKGRSVDDLKPAEIRLTEDSVPQEIAGFTRSADNTYRDPECACFVVDTSPSMNDRKGQHSSMQLARRAAFAVVSHLRKEDTAYLITFPGSLPEDMHPLSTPDELLSLLDRYQKMYSLSPLIDTIVRALRQPPQCRGRQLILVFSDGIDNASKFTGDQLLQDIRERSGAVIIAAGMDSRRTSTQWIEREEHKKAKQLLKKMAETSGGFVQFVSGEKDAVKLLQRLEDLISNQYLLSYRSNDPDRTRRVRSVRIETSRRGVRLHYRQSYVLEDQPETSSKEQDGSRLWPYSILFRNYANLRNIISQYS